MSRPYAFLTIFTASFCTMVIELIAGRLVAPVLGVSLYTWTTVIGVVLAGIGLGNYLGGRIADRYPEVRTLLGLLLLSALTSLSIVLTVQSVGYFHTMPTSWPLVLRFVVVIGMVFFAPTCILGMITPIVLKLSLKDLAHAGNTIGTLYAISLVGSIVGTFATGFYLIQWFGTRTLIVMTAGILAVLAILIAGNQWRWRESALLGLVILGNLGLAYSGRLNTACLRESNYFCIRVSVSGDLSPAKELYLDRLLHSYLAVKDPLELIYGYENVYAVVVENFASQQPSFDAFFIGGGGFVFPYYVTQVYPQSRVTVAEIDPVVTQVARQEMALKFNPPITVHDEDARLWLNTQSRPQQFDIIFGDAFNDFSVPYHLTTVEFTRILKSRMKPSGFYIANVIDSPASGHFLRAFIHTQKAVFANVIVFGNTKNLDLQGRQTFVVVASDKALDGNAMLKLASSKTEWWSATNLIEPEHLEAFLKKESPLILSDDYVPTDILLLPVFEQQ